MVEEPEQERIDELPLEGVGNRLKRAREELGLSLQEIAKETRISLHHLEIIEQDRFAELPGRSYAFGFSRSYARAVGLNEDDLLADLRAELAIAKEERDYYTPTFEPGDPSKAPPRGVILVSALAVILLALGSYFFYARAIAPGANPPDLVAETSLPESDTTAAQGDRVDTGSERTSSQEQVVFTALEEGIWVSFYEASGRRLEQKLMSLGERFVVPDDAQDPRVWTGRPDAFAITIGGVEVAKLSDQEVTIRDVPISARALRDRGANESGADGQLSTIG